MWQMGWNTAAIFVRDRPADEIFTALALSPTGPPTPVTGEQATSGLVGSLLSTRTAGGWTEVWGPSMLLLADPAAVETPQMRSLLGSTDALVVLFSSVASTYGFWLYEHGELRRALVSADGEIVESAGDELDAEGTVEIPSWGRDEDFVWAVIGSVTGQGFDAGAAYDSYEVG
jgi:hypothetical protein